jgi:hypothetical protein
MSQNDSTSLTANIDPGDSTESKQLIKNVKTCDNLDQTVVRITEDKIKLILQEDFKKIDDKKSWIAPFGILISLIAAYFTTDFKNALSVPAQTWQAVWIISMLIIFGWLAVSVIKALYATFSKNAITIDQIVRRLKNETRDPDS